MKIIIQILDTSVYYCDYRKINKIRSHRVCVKNILCESTGTRLIGYTNIDFLHFCYF